MDMPYDLSNVMFITTANDISKPKPDPEGYLLAMENFRSDPVETLIFEDSEVGLESTVLDTTEDIPKIEPLDF